PNSPERKHVRDGGGELLAQRLPHHQLRKYRHGHRRSLLAAAQALFPGPELPVRNLLAPAKLRRRKPYFPHTGAKPPAAPPTHPDPRPSPTLLNKNESAAAE